LKKREKLPINNDCSIPAPFRMEDYSLFLFGKPAIRRQPEKQKKNSFNVRISRKYIIPKQSVVGFVNNSCYNDNKDNQYYFTGRVSQLPGVEIRPY